MKGQWIGNYLGSSNGEIILEIDELKEGYQGVAYLYESNPDLPSSFVSFRIANQSNSFDLEVDVKPMDPSIGPSTWERMRS
jgi:hypothetical protein